MLSLLQRRVEVLMETQSLTTLLRRVKDIELENSATSTLESFATTTNLELAVQNNIKSVQEINSNIEQNKSDDTKEDDKPIAHSQLASVNQISWVKEQWMYILGGLAIILGGLGLFRIFFK